MSLLRLLTLELDWYNNCVPTLAAVTTFAKIECRHWSMVHRVGVHNEAMLAVDMSQGNIANPFLLWGVFCKSSCTKLLVLGSKLMSTVRRVANVRRVA